MYEITEGAVRVFTYREGLLSAVGHDLQLSVPRFAIAVDGAAVTAQFWVDSLVVDGAVREGVLDARTLSRKDAGEIREHTLGKKILHAARHPVIRFTATLRELDGGTLELAGALELAGRAAPLALPVHTADGRIRGAVTLTPSRWGIAPFKALLGTLRIQDRVEVRFDVTDPR